MTLYRGFVCAALCFVAPVVMFATGPMLHAQDSSAVIHDTTATTVVKPVYVLDTTQTLSSKLSDLFDRYYADSSNASLCFDISQEYLTLGRKTYAVRYMDKSLTLDPTNMDVEFAKAELLLDLGRKKSAYESYLKVLRDFKAEAYRDRIAARFASAFKITQITTSSFNDIEPSFSPDGSSLVFQSDRNGNWDIYTLKVAQGEASVTRLTNDPGSDENPAFSPDGRYIVFTSSRDDKSGKRFPTREVYYMYANGKETHKITTSYGADNWNPVFVDTQSVVFASDRLDFTNNPFWQKASGIYSVEKDGNFLFKITGDEKSQLTDPFAIPGGNRLLYVAKSDEQDDIFTANVDGSGTPTNLTKSKGSDIQPSLSRDGSFIAYATNRDGNYEIYRMQADGSDPARITVDDADDIFPHYAPDGTAIVFCSRRNGSYQIFLASLEESSGSSVADLIARLEKKAASATDN